MRAVARLGAAVVGVALALAGCASAPAAPARSAAPMTSPVVKQKVVVFAAASLTAAFKELATQAPGLDISYTFDGSPTLVEQLNAKPDVADVLATADEPNMKKASDAQLIKAQPTIFATNTAVLIVPKDNPGKVTGLNDSLTGKKLVVCAPSVPCGAAARTIAQNAGYSLQPVSEEQKVTDVVGKVTSGEADAGIAFSTDAKSAGDKVATIPLPGADKVVSRYPLAVTAKSTRPEAAAAFVQLVTGEKGRAVLTRYGFTLP